MRRRTKSPSLYLFRCTGSARSASSLPQLAQGNRMSGLLVAFGYDAYRTNHPADDTQEQQEVAFPRSSISWNLVCPPKSKRETLSKSRTNAMKFVTKESGWVFSPFVTVRKKCACDAVTMLSAWQFLW